MTIHGYEDWHRVVQHASAAVLDVAIVTPAVTTYDFGTFFVGDASHLFVYALNGNGAMQLSLTFTIDGTLPHFTGVAAWETDTPNSTINDVVPVLGNWVTVTGNFIFPAAVRTPTVRVVPLTITAPNQAFLGDLVAASIPLGIYAAGAIVTRKFPFVAGGKAQLLYTGNCPAYSVRVYGNDHLGGRVEVAYVDNNLPSINGNSMAFYLPKMQCYLELFNASGGPAVMSGSVILGASP